VFSENVFTATACASIANATTARRKRGPSLSRRTGQKGSVFQHCNPWNPTAPAYGRFWIDMPGEDRQRKTVSLGLCRTRSIAKQKLREYIESTGVNSEQSFSTKTFQNRWPTSCTNTLPVSPVIYSPQRADDHSNNVTFSERCTLQARKLVFMPFVDSARRL
jgi:hypothetical protein